MCHDLETSTPPKSKGDPNEVPRGKQQSEFELLCPYEAHATGNNRSKVCHAGTATEDESQMQLPQWWDNVFRTRIDSNREEPKKQESPPAPLLGNHQINEVFLGDRSPHRHCHCLAHDALSGIANLGSYPVAAPRHPLQHLFQLGRNVGPAVPDRGLAGSRTHRSPE